MIKIKLLLNSLQPVYLKILAAVNLVIYTTSYGTAQRSSLIHDNLKRTFKIFTPSSFNKSSQLPLVIVLHGRGGNGESMLFVTRKGFNKLSERDRFIVVYPDGIEQNWNDGRTDQESNDRAHREKIDDSGFISELIDLMISDLNADPNRVYVTGISNGAIMSYRLACELSTKIAAIAPVDGNIPYMLAPDCLPQSPVSVLAINNINDPLVPYEGGNIYGHFHRFNLGRVLSVDESVSYWVEKNKCLPVPVVTEEPDRDPYDGTRVLKKEFKNETNGTEVILYAIEGGGHTWPGGIQYLPEWLIGKTSRDIDANEVIWNFFKSHSK